MLEVGNNNHLQQPIIVTVVNSLTKTKHINNSHLNS